VTVVKRREHATNAVEDAGSALSVLDVCAFCQQV
jgi:hypothetical protein